MNKKQRSVKRPAGPGLKSARPGGFWDRSEPKCGILSIRHSSSKLARSLAFLRRIAGLGRNND